ncbi:MAG TPA: anti-sigma factor, partial [Burkholderiales bacterium]|nr:anti-sigma factor [Burkholderiales bacterium]
MSGLAVTEAELHAHIDGLLPEARRAEVEEYLATHLEDAQRVRAWREQNTDLRAWFDPVLAESAPARLRRAASGRRKLPLRYAAVLGWIALGGIAGWFLHDYRIEKS